jgi:hypothetical protein
MAAGSLYRNLPLIRARLADLLFIGAVGVGIFSVLLIAGVYQGLAIEVGIISATIPAWVVLILVATGRAPYSDNVGLEATRAKVEKGFVQVDRLG